MRKKLITIALVLIMAVSVSGLTALAATANPTPSTVFLDNTVRVFEAYNIGGSNYFKLRDLAYAVSGTAKQFSVGYDNASKAITLTSGQPYTANGSEMAQGDGKAKTATPTPSRIYFDGRELNLTVYNIGGSNFFKLRDLMELADVYVGYDNATKAITLDTSRGYNGQESGAATGGNPRNVTDYPLTLSDGETGRYTGKLVNGKAEDSNGKFVGDDDYTYIGGFSNNCFNGQGAVTFSNGNKYVGGFKNGSFDGQGTYTWEDGDVYTGSFKDGNFNGQGTLTWTSGGEYTGEWKDGKRDGQGTYKYDNGYKYIGGFKDGKRDGYGTMYNADGTIDKQGEWRAGDFIG